MAVSVKDLLAAANERAPRIGADDARRLMADENALVVDVRDPHEVAASGKLRGAVNISRGMLEFRADPATPYHEPALRPDRPVIVYCASGGRSALACATLQDMGYRKVFNLGGFKDAADAGLETEQG